ncbi:hypothetical protein [uncultured Algibacter sp.]|uniref:hypothetical protein n=1 Tax=uncultured Algibacter sp. TaxID=298659 RepID=UPI0030EF24C5|tara:strand:+ start:77 stop:547 length:471 start_codon:yes stop_codon:yes gene_type:complete
MKNLLLIICIALIFSCKDNSKVDTVDKNALETASDIHTLEGAWKLVSYLNFGEDGSVDTIPSSSTNKQIKMYSPTKVMWSRTRLSDSIDWFAYGDYNVKNGILTEILDYGSKSMNEIIKDKTEFSFNLNISENEFSQVELDSAGHPILAENYIRIE